MKKVMDIDLEKDMEMDEKAKDVLNAQFRVPKTVELAKQEAFERIRKQTGKTSNQEILSRKKKEEKRRKKLSAVYKTAAAMAAAAALFVSVCITNPAWASSLPIVGNVFKEIGESLGFSGDYSKVAKPPQSTEEAAQKPVQEVIENSDAEEGADGTAAFTKTSDGVTLTLSEVYCNDAALYMSMVMESEDPFPETMLMEDGTPYIRLADDTVLDLSFNPGIRLFNANLDGKMVDEHTYMGVLRVDLRDLMENSTAVEQYIADRNAFFKEKGFDLNNPPEGMMMDDIARELGMEEFSDAEIAAAGGPDYADYDTEVEVPEEFRAELKISKIAGNLPQEKIAIPEMPKDLKDAYNQAMAEHGLEEADYENFTEEEKEIEHQLFTEMYNQYAERYPELSERYNSYEYWTIDGDWSFQFDIRKDYSQNDTREVNLLDENGNGIISITKTPFEISLEEVNDNAEYFGVVLDANGDMLPYGKFGGYADTWAIQDRDVSKVHVYLCDYIEYMDELKGYYWSPDYEENKKTKTFKELLDERALQHAEVVFDE